MGKEYFEINKSGALSGRWPATTGLAGTPMGIICMIQMRSDDAADPVARVTVLARNTDSAVFRSNTGRWAPPPCTETLAEAAMLRVNLLAPHVDPNTWTCIRDVVLGQSHAFHEAHKIFQQNALYMKI